MLNPGDTCRWLYTNRNVGKALQDADGSVTGTVYVNGVANAATVTVARLATGTYSTSFVVPARIYSDCVQLVIFETTDGLARAHHEFIDVVLSPGNAFTAVFWNGNESGAIQDYDGSPTASAKWLKNFVDTGATVTLSRIEAGHYTATLFIPTRAQNDLASLVLSETTDGLARAHTLIQQPATVWPPPAPPEPLVGLDWPLTMGMLGYKCRGNPSVSPKPLVLTSTVASGRPKRRALTTRCDDEFTGVVYMTEREKAAFDIWFRRSCLYGTQVFRWKDPMGPDEANMEFLKEPTFAVLVGSDDTDTTYWQMQFDMRIHR